MRKLAEWYDAALETDNWFDGARSDPEVEEFARLLQQRSNVVRGKSKKWNAAVHDAIALLWVERMRAENKAGAWLITTDRSLPRAIPRTSEHSSLALTTDALLQWVSPLAGTQQDEQGFGAGFAQMMRERLLPRDRFFTLHDFLIFHELNISTKDLPTEDVESALLYIKGQGASLDPSNPSDREKLAHGVSRFLVDPGRKYKQDLAESERERIESQAAHIEQLREEREQREAVQAALEVAQKKHGEDVQTLKASIAAVEERAAKDRLASDARWRIAVSVVTVLAIEMVVLYLTSHFAEGDNLFQKVLGALPFFLAVLGLLPIFGLVYIGKDRLIALGGPFPRLFKVGE